MTAQKQSSSLKNQHESTQKKVALQSKSEVRTLLVWKSPSRPFQRRGTEYFKTLGAILFLVSVILLFFKEWLLIGAIAAFFFIVYVLGRFPPEEIEHKITTQGISTGNRNYLWRELSEFWFNQSHNQSILNVEVFSTRRVRLAGRLFLLLGGQLEEKVKGILVQYLPYREIPEKNWMDDASVWLTRKIPLEKTN